MDNRSCNRTYAGSFIIKTGLYPMSSHKYAYFYMYGFLVTLMVRVVGSKH